MQTSMAIAMCGPDALEEYQRYARLMPLPLTESEMERSFLERRVEKHAQGQAQTGCTVYPPTRALAPLPAHAHQQARSCASQASHAAAYEEPSWMQPGMMGNFNVQPAASSSSHAFASQDWQNILNQPLMGMGGASTPAAAQQQPTSMSSRTWGSETITPSTSSSSLFADMLPPLQGEEGSPTTSGGGSSSTADSPEVLETIGSGASASHAKTRAQQYADSLQAVKAFRQLNPTKPKDSSSSSSATPGLPNRHDPHREKPFWIFPPPDVLKHHCLPDGRLTGTMTKDWMHSSPYVGLLTWVLQLKAMSPRQFDEWLKPNVVRMDNFVFPQSDFMRAMYSNAVSRSRTSPGEDARLTCPSLARSAKHLARR